MEVTVNRHRWSIRTGFWRLGCIAAMLLGSVSMSGCVPPGGWGPSCAEDCRVCDTTAEPAVCLDAQGDPPPEPELCAEAPPCFENEVRDDSTCACVCDAGFRFYEGPEGMPGCVPIQNCDDGMRCTGDGQVCVSDAEARAGYRCVCPEGWRETETGCEAPPPPDVCMGIFCPADSSCVDADGIALCQCAGELQLSTGGAACLCPSGWMRRTSSAGRIPQATAMDINADGSGLRTRSTTCTTQTLTTTCT